MPADRPATAGGHVPAGGHEPAGGHGRVRVLIWHRSDGRSADLERTYHEISRRLAGTPGLLGNELWRSADDPDGYAVMSEWKDLAAFQTWADDPEQHQATTALRAYRRPGDRVAELYQVTEAHH